MSARSLATAGGQSDIFFTGSNPRGTIANMAVAARCSTADVALIGFLKDCPDSGTLLDDLNSCGIDTSLITQITDGVEPVCLVFITEGSNAVIYPDRQSETVTLDEQALERISTSTILCSTPEKIRRVRNNDQLARAISSMQVSGGRFVIDADTGAEFDPTDPILSTANILIVNEFGVRRCFATSWDDITNEMPLLTSKYKDATLPPTLIVTGAEKGAWVYTREADSWEHRPAIPTHVVDPTGAGDAFVGTLVAELALDKPRAPLLIVQSEAEPRRSAPKAQGSRSPQGSAASAIPRSARGVRGVRTPPALGRRGSSQAQEHRSSARGTNPWRPAQ